VDSARFRGPLARLLSLLYFCLPVPVALTPRVNYEVYGLYGPEVQCMVGSSVMLAAALFCANDG
jgi:hypothetical protein